MVFFSPYFISFDFECKPANSTNFEKVRSPRPKVCTSDAIQWARVFDLLLAEVFIIYELLDFQSAGDRKYFHLLAFTSLFIFCHHSLGKMDQNIFTTHEKHMKYRKSFFLYKRKVRCVMCVWGWGMWRSEAKIIMENTCILYLLVSFSSFEFPQETEQK